MKAVLTEFALDRVGNCHFDKFGSSCAVRTVNLRGWCEEEREKVFVDDAHDHSVWRRTVEQSGAAKTSHPRVADLLRDLTEDYSQH